MAGASFKSALLSAATAVALCWAALPASGQEAVIAACQALPTEAERFGCLADALRLASGEATLTANDVGLEAPAQAAPSTPAATPSVAPVAAAAPAAVETASEPARRGLRLPFFGGRDEDEQPAQVLPARVASTSAAAQEFGATQAAAAASPQERTADPGPTRMTATVVRSSVVGYKQLQVELDNGQVWRQAQAEDPWDDILMDDPGPVEIWEARFGGYRMLLADRDQTLMVERVR